MLAMPNLLEGQFGYPFPSPLRQTDNPAFDPRRQRKALFESPRQIRPPDRASERFFPGYRIPIQDFQVARAFLRVQVQAAHHIAVGFGNQDGSMLQERAPQAP